MAFCDSFIQQVFIHAPARLGIALCWDTVLMRPDSSPGGTLDKRARQTKKLCINLAGAQFCAKVERVTAKGGIGGGCRGCSQP